MKDGMTITTEKYVRKPLYVDAVQVTVENFDEMVKWCQGKAYVTEGKPYIKVRVHQPKHQRQSMAFVGDWLLYTDKGYKVYTTQAFENSFDLVTEPVGDKPITEFVEATPASIAQAVNENEAARRAVENAEALLNGLGTDEPIDVEAEVKHQMTEGLLNRMGPDKVEPEAAAGKRVLTEEEQRELSADEVRELIQSGEAVLAQDIAKP